MVSTNVQGSPCASSLTNTSRPRTLALSPEPRAESRLHRRQLLHTLGASAVLSLIPGEARAAWARVASGLRPASGLSDSHLALIRAIADTILPRTDTPGASDVGVHGFVDVIVSENYDDNDRAAFTAGLEKIDATVMLDRGRVFQDLPAAERAAVQIGRAHV